VLLIVGVLALVGSSAMVARLVGQGRHATVVSQVATTRFERLRQLASSTSPRCTDPDLTPGSTFTSAVREEWSIASSGPARQVTLALEYRAPRGLVRDTLHTTMYCR
jgi:hypothetical protein